MKSRISLLVIEKDGDDKIVLSSPIKALFQRFNYISFKNF